MAKNQQIGDISEGIANTLPIGAEIYTAIEYPDKDILIVEYDGKEKNYLFQAGE